MIALATNAAPPATRVLAVTSGKGGVGKSTVSINLALALAATGARVTLLDADLGLANVDVMLGLSPTRTLQHVINGECALQEVIVHGPAGIRIIPAASGVQHMAELTNTERSSLIHAFNELEGDSDWLVIDTAAGITANTLQFCAAAQEIVVVVCNDPASITDAYATIKVLHQQNRRHRFRILANMVRDHQEAVTIFNCLLTATDRFLNVALDLCGDIPYDRQFATAARRRKPIITSYPDGGPARAFKKLAHTADTWPRAQGATGQLEFFVEKLIRAELLGRHARA